MCGIAGILSTQPQASFTDQTLAMQAALRHRGPDGLGDYLAPSGQAALAHTRLSIIDLSDNAAQPMSSSDERYSITFNGEIYNYQSLREKLQAEGTRFKTRSDTEVILQLYAKYGDACVTQLRGMFAFMIWDEQNKTGFAARDPFGIKPFYFWRNRQSLVFASELRAILKTKVSDQTISTRGLRSYLKHGTIAEPDTLLSDIHLLPAGHILRWQGGNTTTSAFWEIGFKQSGMTHANAVKTTRAALEDSIKAHLVSDVPVGIFLSGGIDSTALLALASQVSSKPINTYSIAFADPAWNEGDIAQRVATHFGAKHTEFLMTPEMARPLFIEFLEIIDQPTIDGFNTFCVAKLASQHGAKVVLSGLGGDELFAGYKSFELLPKMLRLSKVTSLLSPIIKTLAKLFQHLLSPRLRRSFDFLGSPNSLTAAHSSLRGIFSNAESDALLNLYSTTNEPQKVATTQLASDTQNAISQLELTRYMRNQLLRDSDVTSMASGLELRVPFVDHVLFDQIAKIPAQYRLNYGKKLLIASVPELPEWVTERPKQGFRFPFDEWFSDDWRTIEVRHRNNLPSWIGLTPWYRRWSILVLDSWLTRYTSLGNDAQ